MKNIENMFDFPFLRTLEISILYFMKDTNIPESALSQINKRKQPELRKFRKLESYQSPISGLYIFDSNNNVGWQKLE